MTNRQITLLGLLTFAFTFSAQTFNEKFFVKTSWFANDKDSSFFKSDTVNFIQYTNPGPDEFTKAKAENEWKYLKHGDRVQLTFNKRKKLDMTIVRDNYIGLWSCGRTWTFDNKTNTLLIYSTNEPNLTYKPISKKQIKLTSRFALQTDSLTTTELTLIRIK